MNSAGTGLSNVKPDITQLKNLAKEIRRDILISIAKAGSGHPGGSLSMVELLIGLYYYKLKHDPKQPRWEGRDYFVLSKGHGCPALYTILALRGFFPKEELSSLRKLGSVLQGHVYSCVKGVEASTGSLGQGLSMAVGFAVGIKLDKKPNRVFCIIGDGETQEGQIWEAAMTAGVHKLDNLCAILDYNTVQQNGPVKNIKDIDPIVDKFKAFKWNTIEIDGHNVEEVMRAYDEAEKAKGMPTIVIAHTAKGKGVSFMENNSKWHGKAPNEEELKQALKEIEGLK